MLVIYCDLCGNPIKSKRYILVIAEFDITDKDIIEAKRDYKKARELAELYQKQLENVKRMEICESCNQLHDKLFKLKKKYYQKIIEEFEFEEENKSNDKSNQGHLFG